MHGKCVDMSEGFLGMQPICTWRMVRQIFAMHWREHRARRAFTHARAPEIATKPPYPSFAPMPSAGSRPSRLTKILGRLPPEQIPPMNRLGLFARVMLRSSAQGSVTHTPHLN